MSSELMFKAFVMASNFSTSVKRIPVNIKSHIRLIHNIRTFLATLSSTNANEYDHCKCILFTPACLMCS